MKTAWIASPIGKEKEQIFCSVFLCFGFFQGFQQDGHENHVRNARGNHPSGIVCEGSPPSRFPNVNAGNDTAQKRQGVAYEHAPVNGIGRGKEAGQSVNGDGENVVQHQTEQTGHIQRGCDTVDQEAEKTSGESFFPTHPIAAQKDGKTGQIQAAAIGHLEKGNELAKYVQNGIQSSEESHPNDVFHGQIPFLHKKNTSVEAQFGCAGLPTLE
jgi:hypothetical protein